MRSALLRTGLGLCLLGLVLSLLTGSRASAVVPESCTPDHFCVYNQPGGVDRQHEYPAGATDDEFEPAWAGQVSSVWNGTDYWGCLYETAYYGGEIQAIHPRSNRITDLTADQLADKARSFKLAKSKAGCFTGFERCDVGFVCLFKEDSGRGLMTSVKVPEIAQYNADWDRQAVSVFNHTDQHVCLYPDKNHALAWPGTNYRKFVVLSGDATTLTGDFAKSVRSHKQVGETSQC